MARPKLTFKNKFITPRGIRLRFDQDEMLHKLVRQTVGITINEHIRKAIDLYLKIQKKEN